MKKKQQQKNNKKQTVNHGDFEHGHRLCECVNYFGMAVICVSL